MIGIPEISNLFTKAEVVSVDTQLDRYLDYGKTKRGDEMFCMSRSDLVEFSHCPSRWLAGFHEKDSKQTEWGSLIDCLVLTPGEFDARYSVCPSMYPCEPTKRDPRTEKPWTRSSNYCEAWEKEEEAHGRTVIKPKDLGMAIEAKKALFADSEIADLINGSDHQVMVIGNYEDDATGLVIPVKCLIDIKPNSGRFIDSLADLKTCSSADPSKWGRQVFDYGYHVQAAMCLDLSNSAEDDCRTVFRHVLQENYSPWQTGRRIINSEFVECGRLTARHALRQYAQCLQTGFWPDYDHGRNNIDGWTSTELEHWMVNL